MSKRIETFLIHIYKGEGRILIIPVIDSENSSWYAKIENMEADISIGQGILEAIEVIKNKIFVETAFAIGENGYAIEKNSKYKTWISFWKNNECVRVRGLEDGQYKIYSLIKSRSTRGTYSDIAKEIVLSRDSTKEAIGKAVIEVFKALEEYYANESGLAKTAKVMELLDNSKLTIIPPKGNCFTDNGDSGAAEVYQCYSYSTSENAKPAAEFFLGIAPELDCNLHPESVRSSWEDYYGQADFFKMKAMDYGIFKYRVEMKNKESHKISYLLQQEEDLLLECGMEVHNPNRRKKTDEKLEKMFEEFALSCRMA